MELFVEIRFCVINLLLTYLRTWILDDDGTEKDNVCRGSENFLQSCGLHFIHVLRRHELNETRWNKKIA